jgi:hypothetical protein
MIGFDFGSREVYSFDQEGDIGEAVRLGDPETTLFEVESLQFPIRSWGNAPEVIDFIIKQERAPYEHYFGSNWDCRYAITSFAPSTVYTGNPIRIGLEVPCINAEEGYFIATLGFQQEHCELILGGNAASLTAWYPGSSQCGKGERFNPMMVAHNLDSPDLDVALALAAVNHKIRTGEDGLPNLFQSQ